MSEKEIIREAIDALEPINAELWCVGEMHNNGKHCAYGHLERLRPLLFNKLLNFIDSGLKLATVNDGFDPVYQQETPKERSLAYLNDLLKIVED